MVLGHYYQIRREMAVIKQTHHTVPVSFRLRLSFAETDLKFKFSVVISFTQQPSVSDHRRQQPPALYLGSPTVVGGRELGRFFLPDWKFGGP